MTNLREWAHFFEPEEDRGAAEIWKKGAKCLNTPGLTDALFFPPPVTEDMTPEEAKRVSAEQKAITKDAKRFCQGHGDSLPCPVLTQCLEYAMENQIWEGVYGGTSGRERRKLARVRSTG